MATQGIFVVSDVNSSHDYYSFGNSTSEGIHVNELRDNIIYKKKQNNKIFDAEFNVHLRFYLFACSHYSVPISEKNT